MIGSAVSPAVFNFLKKPAKTAVSKNGCSVARSLKMLVNLNVNGAAESDAAKVDLDEVDNAHITHE